MTQLGVNVTLMLLIVRQENQVNSRTLFKTNKHAAPRVIRQLAGWRWGLIERGP